MIKPHVKMDLADIIKPFEITEIVSSKTFKGGRWKEEMYSLNHPEPNIHKFILPVDFTGLNLAVITEIPPNTTIGVHSHAEPLFRYIISGEVQINGELYKAGDWVILPVNHPYSVSTVSGYSTFGKYGENCEECGHKIG